LDDRLDVGTTLTQSDDADAVAERLFEDLQWAWGCTQPMSVAEARNYGI
jgi:hypothetical protein